MVLKNPEILQWTAKVSKENLKNLIHSYNFLPELKPDWITPTTGPNCPFWKTLGMDHSSCLTCDHYDQCRNYNNELREMKECKKSTTAVRRFLQNKYQFMKDKRLYQRKSSLLNGHSYCELKNNQSSKGELICYIFLHLLHPDDDGFIRDVRFSHLSDKTTLAISTIRKCMSSLRERGFIDYGNNRYDIEYGCYDFQILDYEKTFLSARQGGKGFVHFNHSTFTSLLPLTVNDLRITLLALCDADVKDNADGCVEVTYDRFCGYLPGYLCKAGFSRLLDKIKSTKDGIFQAAGISKICYRAGMNARKDYQECREFLSEELRSYTQEVNECIEKLKHQEVASPLADQIRKLCDIRHFRYEPRQIKESLIKNMVSLCMDFSVSSVKRAYLIYICDRGNTDSTKNAGRDLRHICSGFWDPGNPPPATT